MMQVYDRVLGSRSVETLGALCILMVFLYVIMGILDYARGRIAAHFGARFQADLDQTMFSSSLSHALTPKGRVLAATGFRDLETVQGFLSSPIFLALMDTPWTPIYFVALFLFNPYLGAAALAGGIILVLIAVMSQLTTRNRLKVAEQKATVANSLVEQARRASELILSQGMEDDMTTRWQALRREALTARVRAADRLGSFTSVTKSFRFFLQSAILAIGAYLVLKNEMTGGSMMAGSVLMGRALAPLEQCIGGWRQIERSFAAYSSLKEFFATSQITMHRNPLPRPVPILDISDVSVRPPQSTVTTLKNFSLHIEAGTSLGVIGPSGSGKSTLAKALLGLWKPEQGTIRFGGAKIHHYDPKDFGRYVGYLPQDVFLFSGTIAENIARMAAKPNGEKVIRAAKRADVHNLIASLPDGYNTVLAGNDGFLSGGQKQRIALARALYEDPVLLILDEPNSALDPTGSAALNEVVKKMKAEQKTVILMTHRSSAIQECDKILVISDGEKAAYGTREEVMKTLTGEPEDQDLEVRDTDYIRDADYT